MKVMKKKALLFLLSFSGLILFLFLLMQPLTILYFHEKIAFLFPKGLVALKQRNLLFISQFLMLLVIIPVYILTFVFSWKYRSSNPEGDYDPDLVDHKIAEVIWWGFPFAITILISIITWYKTHELDPYKPLQVDKPAKTIQVVALPWRWLFIYPEEKIASLNFLQFPKETEIHFEITADAPMNSFWIPDLGGQIYAMPSMKTELHLIADVEGDFRGSSANLSGEGFSGMTFIARASSEEDYAKWLETAKTSPQSLNKDQYDKLALPNKTRAIEIYQLEDPSLFNYILHKYMHPHSQKKEIAHHE